MITEIDSPMAPDSSCSEGDDDLDTQTLSPSITDYPVHWGRTYHRYKENSYLFPNDEWESDRLDFNHHIFTQLHGGRFFFAPLTQPRRILDIGTGTGIWPICLADADIFPSAKIVGTDLSPIQPQSVPANVSFEIHDCSEPNWNRPLNSIDYIHIRMLIGSLSSFEDLLKTSFKYLTPATGWLECHELDPMPFSDDGSIPPKWAFSEWAKNMERASASYLSPPRPVRIANKIKQWMADAGYVDIHEHVNKVPVCSWPKDKDLKRIGHMWAENVLVGLPAWSYKLFGSEGLGWSRDEIEVNLASVRNSIAMRSVHAYNKLHVVYGRKPSKEEEEKMKKDKKAMGKS